MKSLQEILAKLSEDKPTRQYVLDIDPDHLLQFVPYDKVGYYLKPDVTEEEWEEYYRPLNKGNVIGCMEQYMKHAWERCLKGGVQSSRITIRIYHAWLWILEDTKTIAYLLDPKNYSCYGAPILLAICRNYNWNYKDFIDKWELDTARNFLLGKGC